MTFGEILHECAELGNTSERIEIEWRGFVNRAQQRIAQRRDWSMMHDQRRVTIAQGALSAVLDANFKKLSSEKSPVSYQDPTAIYNLPIPCEVVSRAAAEQMGYSPWFAPFPTAPYAFPIRYVFIERNGPGGRWTINLPKQYATNPSVTFTVSGYYYPDTLKNADDTNAFTEHPELCDAIINLAKGLAYASEDVDPQREGLCMQRYEAAYKHAAYSDASQRFQGRQLRM